MPFTFKSAILSTKSSLKPILSTKSSLKFVELVETPDAVQVGHTFNEIFFETRGTPDPVQVGHTFNEIFFKTRGNSRSLWPYFQRNLLGNIGHTFNEIFFKTRGTRGNSLRKLRTFEVFLDFFGGCSTSGGWNHIF